MGEIIKLPEPEITFFDARSQISRYYDFSITQTSAKGEGLDQYKIEVSIYRYVRRKAIMSDGSERLYTEDNDPQKPFYTMNIGTNLNFADTIKLFKDLGLTKRAEIPLLSYGDTYVKNVGNSFFDKLEKMHDGEEDIPHVAKSVRESGEGNEQRRYFKTPFVVGDLDILLLMILIVMMEIFL